MGAGKERLVNLGGCVMGPGVYSRRVEEGGELGFLGMFS